MRSTSRTGALVAAAVLVTTTPAATAVGSASGATTRGGGRTTASGASSAVAVGEPVTTADGVEVTTWGTARVAPSLDSRAQPVYQAVHAVQRVGDRTVVYWSVGWPAGEPGVGFRELGRSPFDSGVFNTYGSPVFVNVVLPQEGLLLYAVPDPDATGGSRLAASSATEALPSEPGRMHVLYSVLPGLPEGVGTVDVTLGHAGLVTDVPVGDGLLEPTVDGPTVPLGSGWPEVPERFLEPVAQPDLFLRPLSALSEGIDGFVREADTGDQVVVDLGADVLFAVDSAELTPDAVARLEGVAAEVAARAAPGAVTVTGHTDSDADEAYNDDLSLRRAEAVAAALGPALGGRELQVAGRGEREPVADNSTPEGRQLNRRVSVGFAEAGGQG